MKEHLQLAFSLMEPICKEVNSIEKEIKLILQQFDKNYICKFRHEFLTLPFFR